MGSSSGRSDSTTVHRVCHDDDRDLVGADGAQDRRVQLILR